jgi:hypothetical protein
MHETPQDYTARMLASIGDRNPRTVLAETPSRLRSLLAGATTEALRYTPSPDRWSAVQILAHLGDSEIAGAWRLRSILARDRVELQAFDQNAWAAAFEYERADPDESLAVFEVVRRANLRLLETVDPARHRHVGLHQERGEESVAHIVRMYAGHDLNHLGQIERLLSWASRSR